MVVLIIIAPSSEHTVYFKEPLSNPSYIRLLSASLYNSWYNLKKRTEIAVTKTASKDSTIVTIELGHYTPESLVRNLQSRM